jgi:nucleoside triphosphate diphosphatase
MTDKISVPDTDQPNMDRLREIMARLRDPETGCPWDVEQDFSTIAPHTIEEAYEVAEAIEHGDMPGLVDELGDLLLQVVFHAQMASEVGLFDFDDVAAAICDKLVRRHPHVFGDATIDGVAAQSRAWEEQKAEERRTAGKQSADDESALDGVTVALPALTRALKLQKRAARVGFDWPDTAGALAKLAEESRELEHEMTSGGTPERLADEMGDLLFSCVNLARKLDIDPETALRHGNSKFEKRFRRMERMMKSDGRRLDAVGLAEKEGYWQRVKAEV